MVPEGETSIDDRAMQLIWDGFEKAKKLLAEKDPFLPTDLKCIIEIRAVLPETGRKRKAKAIVPPDMRKRVR